MAYNATYLIFNFSTKTFVTYYKGEIELNKVNYSHFNFELANKIINGLNDNNFEIIGYNIDEYSDVQTIINGIIIINSNIEKGLNVDLNQLERLSSSLDNYVYFTKHLES